MQTFKTAVGSIPKMLALFSYKICLESSETRKKGATWGKRRKSDAIRMFPETTNIAENNKYKWKCFD